MLTLLSRVMIRALIPSMVPSVRPIPSWVWTSAARGAARVATLGLLSLLLPHRPQAPLACRHSRLRLLLCSPATAVRCTARVLHRAVIGGQRKGRLPKAAQLVPKVCGAVLQEGREGADGVHALRTVR